MTDKQCVDEITIRFFDVFSNLKNQQPDWNRIFPLCLPEVLIISKTGAQHQSFSLESFLEPRKKILSDGSLIDFMEWETQGLTSIAGNIAHRESTYKKSGFVNDKYFESTGKKFFQFLRTNDGWKITSLIWEDD